MNKTLFCILLIGSHFAMAQAAPRKPVPKLPAKPNLSVPYSETELMRVDPHGSRELKPTVRQALEQRECLVCHTHKDDKLFTKTNSLESCLNCHNKSPHSGVQEHLSHKVQCTDCHTFHRGDSIIWTGASEYFGALSNKKVTDGLRIKNNPHPMLRKTCTDCHK